MTYQLLHGDCLDAMATLPAASVDALICDPPAGISFMGREWDAFKVRRRENEPSRGARNDGEGAQRGFGRGFDGVNYSPQARDIFIAWLAERLSAARRVLKPGHYALVWALPRTSHWTGMACEDAGFTVIDICFHAFGSGFPKGKNKLKPAVEEWWLIRAPGPAAALHIDACRVGLAAGDKKSQGGPVAGYAVTGYEGGWANRIEDSNPSGRWPPNLILSHSSGCIPNGVKRVRGNGQQTDGARRGNGMFGQIPDGRHYADADRRETVNDFICEPGCPVRGLGEMSGESRDTAHRRKHGGASVGNGVTLNRYQMNGDNLGGYGDTGTAARYFPNLDPPEWICSPDCAIRQLDEMSGELTSGSRNGVKRAHDGIGTFQYREHDAGTYHEGDTGGASRYYPNLDPPFFYAAKASRRERGAGCDNLYWLADDTRGSGYRPITRAEYEEAHAWNVAHEDDRDAQLRIARGNMHPTVKSLKLLSWLINLLTVPGDTILDPFAGSGSIGVAALLGGRSFVGVEMDEDYMAICEARLAHAAEQPRQMEIAV